ncbi:MAG: mechanosensitive ion channel [Desulfobacterales bacterium]
MSQTEKVSNVFSQLNEVTVTQILFILVAAIGLIIVSQKFFQWLSEKLSGRYKLYALASVPVLRMLIILLAVIMIIPRVVEPTFENLVAVLGAVGLALGFAFKDYISSLIAGVVTLYEIPYRVEVGSRWTEPMAKSVLLICGRWK